mmetsp:Transcript_28250/g.92207  ORF Transcript_28250/g.92207 Transcript_28250/m.92207 type:complete len:295 (-) Transcript_28250:71-955(-)
MAHLQKAREKYLKQLEKASKVLEEAKAGEKDKGKKDKGKRKADEVAGEPAGAGGAAKRAKGGGVKPATAALKAAAPVSFGGRLKLVLDTLMRERRALSPDELLGLCGVDVREGGLFDELKQHRRVELRGEGEKLEYRPEFNLESKADLLRLLKDTPEGVRVRDLRDAYPGVDADAYAIVADGGGWLLRNVETGDDVIFNRDPVYDVSIDPEIQDEWHSTTVPVEEEELFRELRAADIKPRPRPKTAAGEELRRRRAPRKQQRRRGTKLENSHIDPALLRTPEEQAAIDAAASKN